MTEVRQFWILGENSQNLEKLLQPMNKLITQPIFKILSKKILDGHWWFPISPRVLVPCNIRVGGHMDPQLTFVFLCVFCVLSIIVDPYMLMGWLLTLYKKKANSRKLADLQHFLKMFCPFSKKNYETYNNKQKEQVLASSSKFQIKRFR